MSAPRDLDEIPPELRYAAPGRRGAEGLFLAAPEEPTVSLSLTERLEQRNEDCREAIATAIRRFTYIAFVEWCEQIKHEDHAGLWQWAKRYGCDSSES